MPTFNDHHHIILTTEQWQDKAVEYYIIPRGCLCIELKPNGKTKIKIGEGNKYYAQLPYVCEDIDLSAYLKIEDFHTAFDPVKDQVDEIYPLAHTHDNKDILDQIKVIFTDKDKEKLDSIVDYGDDINDLKKDQHTHPNKDILDQIDTLFTKEDKEKLEHIKDYDEVIKALQRDQHTHANKELLDTIVNEYQLWTLADREKFDSIIDYGDDIIEIKSDIQILYDKVHTHDNKEILDQIDTLFTKEEKEKLESLKNYEKFVGTDGLYPGVPGLVPGPSAQELNMFLCSDGTWKPAGGELLPATPDTLGGVKVGSGLIMTDDDHLRLDASAVKTYYDAGEGIEIVADGGYVDPINGHFLSRLGYLTQYMIYGNGTTKGVGDGAPGSYIIPMTITAEGQDTINATISIPQQLFAGDYIDYRNQIVHYSKSLLYTRSDCVGIYTYTGIWIGNDGYKTYSPQDVDWYWFRVTPGMKLGVIANIGPEGSYANWGFLRPDQPIGNSGRFERYHGVFRVNNNTFTSVTVPETAGYLCAIVYFDRRSINIYKMEDHEEQLTLPTVYTHPNVENVLTINTSVKPSNVFIETSDPEEEVTSEGAMIGVIYNKGVLDVTQEDPENLNELTIHFQKNESKIIEIPKDEYILPIASSETLGGIKLGEGLEIDPETGVVDVVGGGISKEYVAGKGIIFNNVNTSGIPGEYTDVEYIGNVSNSGIMTDYKPNTRTSIIAKVNIHKGTTEWQTLFGVRDGVYPGGNEYAFMTRLKNNYYFYPRITGDTYSYMAGTYDEIITIAINNTTITVSKEDGSTYSYTQAGTLKNFNSTLAIFALNNTVFADPCIADLYSFKIYEEGILVRDYIPCFRNIDGVIGLYETKTNTFLTNVGGGVFTKGDAIIGKQAITAKLGDGLAFDEDNAIEVINIQDKIYSEIDDAGVFTLLREKPADWDIFWMTYFRMDYVELTEEPEKFDPTKHYKYMNDAYVRGDSTDPWTGPIWYDKRYTALPANEHVDFISDLYYTAQLKPLIDGETIGDSLSKIHEDLQMLSGKIDNKVGAKMESEESENLILF